MNIEDDLTGLDTMRWKETVYMLDGHEHLYLVISFRQPRART